MTTPDWVWLAGYTLSVIGVAGLLSILGFATDSATRRRESLPRVLFSRGYARALDLDLALLCLGAGLGTTSQWMRILLAVSAVALVAQALRPRRSRD